MLGFPHPIKGSRRCLLVFTTIMSILNVVSRSGAAVRKTAFSTVFNRTKATLTDLKYDFGALEPHISGQINELHYTKHHQTYANNYNNFIGEFQEAVKTNDLAAQEHLLPLLNFNAGGVINHNLWWNNLAPQKDGGGEPPASDSALAKAIESKYGQLSTLTDLVNTKLAGVQGSGWAWIVKDKATNTLDVLTTANQDIVPKGYVPIVGVDAWEHAYYLQYKNVKVDYFKAVWNVVNWQEAVRRFDA